MLETGAVLYFFIAIYTAGLLSPFLTSERAQVTAVTSVYRPIGLSFIILHCIAHNLNGFHFTLGVVANASYILALVAVSQELKFERTRIFGPHPFSKILWLGLIILGLVFFGRIIFGLGREYASLIILLALGAELMLISVIYKISRQLKSTYLSQAMFASILTAGIMIIRLVVVNSQSVFSFTNSSESGLLIALRMLNAASFFILLNAVTNFHFQKLWNKERELRLDIERASLDSLLALSLARDRETGNRNLRKRKYVGVLIDNLRPKRWLTIPDLDARMEYLFNFGTSKYDPKKSVDGHSELLDMPDQASVLPGDNNPQMVQLIALADVYDILTSKRPWKRSWTHKQAVEEITNMAGNRLDRTVVAAFLEEQMEFLAIADVWQDD
jgi:hypothetical protein